MQDFSVALTLDEDWFTQNKPCLVISNDDGASSASSTHQASGCLQLLQQSASWQLCHVAALPVHPAAGSALCKSSMMSRVAQCRWHGAGLLCLVA